MNSTVNVLGNHLSNCCCGWWSRGVDEQAQGAGGSGSAAAESRGVRAG